MTVKTSRFFTPTVLLILSYEWLVSGIDKVFSGTFVSDMHHQMMQAIPSMQYHFYARLLVRFGMPHCVAMATIVEVGEIFVGIAFALLAIFVIVGKLNAPLAKLGVIAGVTSALMTLNFFFYQGGSFFVNTSDPFDEGIPIDLIMVPIQLAAAGYFWSFIRPIHRNVQITPITHRAVTEQSDATI